MYRNKRKKMTAWQVLALGYLVVVIIGAVLLRLPIATREGESTTFTNALFTSTSATCVTGLIAYDTNTHWTLFGQLVILCLIQLGGLGFMTIVTLIFRIVGKGMGLAQSKAFMLSAGEDKRSELRRLFRRIIGITVAFELLGAALLAVRFCPQFGGLKGAYYAVWHSVSAFCNAGFDLMGGVFNGEKFVSLTAYATDPLVSLTIAGLIIVGGLGFCVWDDLFLCKGKWKKIRLHTKVALAMTVALLLFSTLLFLLFERDNPDFVSYSVGEKILVSFFNAVTPRTAGFNTVDYATMSDAGYLLTVMLMFIGGSSGSTAGGVKITTFFVILMGMIAVFRGKRDIELGKRRVHNALLRQALTIFVSCLFIVLIATIAICSLETHNPATTFQGVLFETFSAMGTVGLTLGITPTLSVASKYILMLLMYAGRVGILTIGLAVAEKKETAEIKKPVDTLLIG
ncbi:MAG: Trk family potassium uptake protein [Clostridiales bacterium]|nr:Trk family potassium uptake protein [Clostridiales bacterium]